MPDGDHAPALLEEAVAALQIKPDGAYVDATFGRGGHSRRILALLGRRGRLLALDRDPAAEAVAKGWADPRFVFRRARFFELGAALDACGIAQADGVLLDLGISSPQIDDPARGFSLRADGPLDMRMDPTRGISAAEWIAHASEREERLLRLARSGPSSGRSNWPHSWQKPSARGRGVIGVRIRPRGLSRLYGFSSIMSFRNCR